MGFIEIKIWDILDILIVGYLMYQIYKLLKGSIAFNIFIGVLLLYAAWWLVGALKMDLLTMVLGQFVSVGVISIVIIFQQEIRRFLLLLGNTTLRGRHGFLGGIVGRETEIRREHTKEIGIIKQTIQVLSEHRTGALIVLANNLDLFQFSETGVVIDANISESLLLSIFNKESPLHDGAVVINDYKIHAASCILPVSDNMDIPQWAGLRHRAALGISESANVVAIVVSEENGKISLAQQGKLIADIHEDELLELLEKYY